VWVLPATVVEALYYGNKHLQNCCEVMEREVLRNDFLRSLILSCDHDLMVDELRGEVLFEQIEILRFLLFSLS
jgi:hypothetical protein